MTPKNEKRKDEAEQEAKDGAEFGKPEGQDPAAQAVTETGDGDSQDADAPQPRDVSQRIPEIALQRYLDPREAGATSNAQL